MNIRHIKVFIEVYNMLNITKAAEKLNMTQPAVTRSIKETENYYNVQLFERINHRLKVTEAGKELYRQSLHIIDSFNMLEKSLHNWDNSGIIKIGSSVTIGNCLLPQLLIKFKKEYPNMQVKLYVMNCESLQKALIENKLDLALMESTITKEHLSSEIFYNDNMVLISPKNHPLLKIKNIILSDLTKYDLLMREQGSAGRSLIESTYAVKSLPFNPTMTSISTQAIINCVKSGLGISILPLQLVKNELNKGNLFTKEITDINLCRNYNIVWHESKYFSPSLNYFKTICEQI